MLVLTLETAMPDIYGKMTSPRKQMAMGNGGYGNFGTKPIPGSNSKAMTSPGADLTPKVGSPVGGR